MRPPVETSGRMSLQGGDKYRLQKYSYFKQILITEKRGDPF